jgi:glycosyltransferase involved in cell wall biosynthesis/O-antigen/teichoic acid export membrane protein
LERPLHILVLSDRDWTHPQGGGTGTNLFGQVSRWVAWGHRVTVVASSYPGAAPVERHGPLTLMRMGGRSTVFPRVVWRGLRGKLPDADVVVEVINGITFLTPLWLRRPRLALVHHVHRTHYVEEMGAKGKVAAYLLETAPLRYLYRSARFLTISEASARDIAAHGIPREQIDVSYIGVESEAFGPDESMRAERPTLLYLGRLKRYKRLELLLDALEAVPDAVLEIAGDGDHRPELEREIEARGLGDRVRLHGHVAEEEKLRLLQSAWVNLTASSAEGWCLTVMESAACATPSAACAVGGLPESIVHGRTGVLVDDPAQLGPRIRELVEDRALREELGRAARERALEFTWDRTAAETLAVLEDERTTAAAERPPLRILLGRTDTGRAAGLAAALIANNFIALLFTIVFARLLGASGYGSLGALVAAFAILLVPGSALQATVAREVSAAAVSPAADPAAGVRRWLGRLVLATVCLAIVAVPLREPMATIVGVDDQWAAAAVLPTGALWLVLCVQRGALQGLRRYGAVGLSIMGEGTSRLLLGLALYGAGLGVTGAFLGTTASLLAVSLVLLVPLWRALEREGRPEYTQTEPRFRGLLSRARAPVAAFTLIAALQNIDIVYVKHQAAADAAGSYAAASVAAKAVIWVAIGLGLYLLPEAVRRTKLGEDARPVLMRTLALVALVAVPMVAVYAVAGHQLLAAVFGEDLTAASSALPLLGLAMSLLAWGYLSVQYLLALGRASFVLLLALAAVVEPPLLIAVGAQLTDVAAVIAGLQLVLAPAVFLVVLRNAAGVQAAQRGAMA